jgi:hypothetical protein
MTKAAIYCRVSSEMQADDEIPILGQFQECEAFAKSKNGKWFRSTKMRVLPGVILIDRHSTECSRMQL